MAISLANLRATLWKCLVWPPRLSLQLHFSVRFYTCTLSIFLCPHSHLFLISLFFILLSLISHTNTHFFFLSVSLDGALGCIRNDITSNNDRLRLGGKACLFICCWRGFVVENQFLHTVVYFYSSVSLCNPSIHLSFYIFADWSTVFLMLIVFPTRLLLFLSVLLFSMIKRR